MLGMNISAWTQITITLGTQIAPSGATNIGPTNRYWESRRIQWVITAAEIVTAGGISGNITAMAYDVSEIAGGNLVNYEVKMAHTSAVDASSHHDAALTTVVDAHTFTPGSTGWRTLAFNTPFDWNGSDNILFDICWGVNPGYSMNGQVWLYNYTINQMRGLYSSDTNQCGTSTTTTVQGKPRLQLTIQPDDPLAVTLATFTAQLVNDDLTIFWSTYSEVNNQGWNIYRSAENSFDAAVKLNSNIIQGMGTTNEFTEYEYVDRTEVINQTTYFYWIESVDYADVTHLHGPVNVLIPAEQDNQNAPETHEFFGLAQNFPNPFNPNTEIMFKMQHDGNVKISVYNVKGEKVTTLTDEFFPGKALRKTVWNGRNQLGKSVASGVYYYKLESKERTEIKKMMLIK